MQLSYSYLHQVVSKIVQTDPRFSMIRQQKPIAEIVSFFHVLFIRLFEKWIHIYPNDFLVVTDDALSLKHLNTIVAEIAPEYSVAFVCAFFVDALRLSKSNVSSPLYEDVLMRCLTDERNVRWKHFPGSEKMAVIVDPRYDNLMQAVICNFMHFLNPRGWNLMIFSAALHKERITADFPTCLFAAIDDALLVRDSLGRPNMHVDTYNDILLSKAFWQSIPATRIAIFQKDCVMYNMFDESLFLSYDFAGANYFHDFAGAPFSGGINGGFSLRNRDAMIACIEHVSWDSIIDYNTRARPLLRSGVKTDYHLETRNEDVFFTNACEILGKRMPDIILREHLAIETGIMNPSVSPSVYHGWNKNYHDLDTAKSFLVGSPFFMKYIHNVSD